MLSFILKFVLFSSKTKYLSVKHKILHKHELCLKRISPQRWYIYFSAKPELTMVIVLHPSLQFLWNPKVCYRMLIRSNDMQHNAGVYLLQNYSTCFGCLSHPSSGVHQTVIAASGTGHSIGATNFRQRGLVCRTEFLYRGTNTRCRIGTVFSPDDGHIVARNM